MRRRSTQVQVQKQYIRKKASLMRIVVLGQ